MKAYKATNKKMQCLGFQFELDKEFIHEGKLIFGESGFHFCKELINVFNYYEFTPNNRFFEVEISDNAEVIDKYNKSVTNKIKFIRELSSAEIKELTNGEYYIDTDGGWKNPLSKMFFNKDGDFHHTAGPAVIWKHGKKHRLEWYRNGLVHRDDGPAIIDTQRLEWWQHGVYKKNEYRKFRIFIQLIKEYFRKK